MDTDSGRVPDGTGLSSQATEPQERFGPSGFDPSRWQPISTAPMHTRILVAYHGHGENIVNIVSRIDTRGYWGDYDYINSHDGEPKYWMPLPVPPDDIAGPDCGCDGCTEEYYGDGASDSDGSPEGGDARGSVEDESAGR